MVGYIASLDDGSDPVAGEELLDPGQRRLEQLRLGLRTSDGVSLAVLDHIPDADRTVRALVDEGLVRVADGRLRPTLAGLALADGMPLRFQV